MKSGSAVPSIPAAVTADRRFRGILILSFLIYGLGGAGVGFMKVDPVISQGVDMLSPRMAKLIIPPKPPPPKPEVIEPEVVEPDPEEEPEEVPEEEPEEVASLPSPEERAQEERRKNIEVAMNSGLLKILKQAPKIDDSKARKAFSEVRALSDGPDKRLAGLSSLDTAQSSRGIDDIVAKLEKAIKDSSLTLGEARTESGGVNKMMANIKTDVGRSTLKERKTTAVESPFKIKGFEDGDSPRSYESIAKVVASYKGGVSFLYNKSLRKNPTLRGTITVEFIVAANGEVIDCRVVASSMRNIPFEEGLIRRILQWKFPPVPAGDVTITYPMVFSVTG